MSATVAPSGEQWTFSAGEYRGTVVSVGGGLRGLSSGDRQVLVDYAEDQMAHAGIGQHLFPWPNRIADGKYTFAGSEQQLSLTEPTRQNAIHGLTRWANWSRLDNGSDESVVEVGYRLHGEPGYPHQLDLSVRYSLDATEGLAVEATATNIGRSDAPYGFGTHPYLTVGRPIDECELTFTAPQRLDVTEDRLLPVGLVEVAGTEFDFGQPKTVGGLFIDNAFTGLAAGWRVRLTDPATGRSAELSSDTPWMQLYSGDAIGRAGLAVEPMTCPPNAFATGEDLITLKPGDSHTTRFTVAGRP
jgi:aldose 1-epimerase